MLFGLAAVGSSVYRRSPAGCGRRSRCDSSIGPHVRGATPAVNAMLAMGIKRSTTFARLVRDLDDTDVIVYVEIVNSLPTGLDGRLTFPRKQAGSATCGCRCRPTPASTTSSRSSGHELQHAMEIAEHPSVQDSEGVAALYKLIGLQAHGVDRYRHCGGAEHRPTRPRRAAGLRSAQFAQQARRQEPAQAPGPFGREHLEVDPADRALLELERHARTDQSRRELAHVRLVPDDGDARFAHMFGELLEHRGRCAGRARARPRA